MEPLKDLIERLAKDRDKFKLDRKMLEGLDPNDPQLKQFVKDWLKSQSPDTLPTPEQMEKLKASVQKLGEKASANPPTVEAPPSEPIAPARHRPPESPPPPPPPGAINGWLERTMQRAERSRLGEWLRPVARLAGGVSEPALLAAKPARRGRPLGPGEARGGAAAAGELAPAKHLAAGPPARPAPAASAGPELFAPAARPVWRRGSASRACRIGRRRRSARWPPGCCC